MKKILLTIALVLLCGVTMAQKVVTKINTTMFYTLECRSGVAHSTTRFIGINDNGVINGQSSTPVCVTFEEGDAGSYYIKVGDKYINCDGTNLSASTEKSTAWILGTVGNTVTFKNPGSTRYLNNNGTSCKDGTITGLQANNHPNGPNAGNACSTWEIKEYNLEKWKEVTLKTLGYVGGYNSGLKEEIEAIDTNDKVLAFEYSRNILTLNTNDYYRIVAVSPKAANGDTNHKVLAFNGEGNLVTTPSSASNINQIFKFENAGNGTFYLKNLNADGYLNKIAAGDYRSAIVAKSSACKLDLTHYGSAQWKLHNSESNDSRHCLFAENHKGETIPYACSGWENGANSASAWYIIPATDIEITVNEYASVYLPFAVEVVGATAYAVTATDNGYATLTEMADIAANEGAILAGNGTATLNIINTAKTNWSANLLEGTTYNKMIEGEAYVLGNVEGVGLYKALMTDGKWKNNANKAYLPMSTASGAAHYSFRFEGEGTTGIDEVKTENGEVKAIYDLTGRRIEAITAPGIYIVGGKKVLVK
jgi:hypothetical protein